MKKYLHFLCLFLFSSSLFGQNIQQLDINVHYLNACTKWQPTADGGYVGVFSDIDKTYLGNLEHVIKFDSNIEVEWVRKFQNSSGFSKLIDLKIDAEGKILVLADGDDKREYIIRLDLEGNKEYGNRYALNSNLLFRLNGLLPFSDSIMYAYGGLCSVENFVTKLNYDGTVYWSKEYDLTSDFNNGFSDGMKMGENSLCLLGNDKMFSLVYLDTAGAMTNHVLFEGPNHGMTPIQMLQDSNGDFLIFGYGSGKYYAFKISANNTLIWAQTWEHPNFDKLMNVAEVNDGEFLITGNMEQDDSIANEGLLMLMDADGQLKWSVKNTPAPSDDYFGGIFFDDDHNLLLGVHERSKEKPVSFYKVSDYTSNEIFLCEYDTVVIQQTNITAEMSTNQGTFNLNDMELNVPFSTFNTSNANNVQAMVICESELPTSLTTVEKDLSVAVFPNPATDAVTIEWNDDFKPTELRIYDVLGRMLFYQKMQLSDESVQLDLAGFSKGMFLVALKDGRREVIERVVKR